LRQCNVAIRTHARLNLLKLKCCLLAGRQEKEYEMTLKRTLQSICLLTVHPNTTTSVILQVRLPPLHSAMPCDCIACFVRDVLLCALCCVRR
jgi:exosome complex component RRP46